MKSDEVIKYFVKVIFFFPFTLSDNVKIPQSRNDGLHSASCPDRMCQRIYCAALEKKKANQKFLLDVADKSFCVSQTKGLIAGNEKKKKQRTQKNLY